MQSKMEMWRDEEGIHFRGTVRPDDFPRLGAFDRGLLDDCGREDATAADWLLALECIFRRADLGRHKERT